ncbi:hypothetical protein PV04_03444 [Phialophora macrospora]|uniref:Zn(2)-C6 fungal-type domain-containing protein n=1 Tax=Phialophora macrospora TaxID=1851006 RepID=A0A0D2GG83_9EURO|nr:hypothetical protein PV04_03444 [Phialophora macrospora]
MTDFSSLTSRFRAVPREDLRELAAGKVVRRPRDSHVCVQCRRSKLKCDRNLPCSSCVRRGDPANCNYPRQSGAGRQSDDNRGNRQTLAEDRLLHLESLFKQLMETQALTQANSTESPAKPATPPAVSSDPIREPQEEALEGVRYVGSTHWSAILDDIQELRAVLANAASYPEPVERHMMPKASLALGGHPELIFGSSDNYSLERIISLYLPPKPEVDRLLSIYFQGEIFIVPFIHTRQFQRQYRDFWADTATAHPLWVSTLFSVCCIANLIKVAQGQTSPGLVLTTAVSKLHTAAAQCLVLGEYYRPQPQAVEAFALYAQCKNLWTLDPSREAGAILGMVVRMAYEMGYHRDPDSYGSFSIFEGEMRRRFWSACKQVDLMISFQLGLPSNIRLETTDTKPPRNLVDSDFDEDSTVLPPSRPESEPTRMLWFIVKDRQMPGLSKVCQDALSFREKTETEVLELDYEIQQMYDTIPEILRTRKLSESIMDPPFLIMTRLYVEFIYLKSLLVLHRRYMARGVVSSTHSCINAAKRLVGQFIDMYREFAEGGQLFTERWMLTNITMNDFLLGIMVLCLAVHLKRKSISRSGESIIDSATEIEVLGLLDQSHAICVEKSSSSKDAQRVTRAVRLILDAVRLSSPQTCGPGVAPSTQGRIGNSYGGSNMIGLSLQPQTEHPLLPEIENASFDTLYPFSFMGNDFDDVNWMAFEPQMSTQGASSSYPDPVGPS